MTFPDTCEPDENGWTAEDYRALIREAYSGQFEPEHFLLFATNESGLAVHRPTPTRRGSGTFAYNPAGAHGLWQCMGFVLKNLGWKPGDPDFDATSGDFLELGVQGQVRWFGKYLADWRGRFHFGKVTDPGTLYLLNFAPARLPFQNIPDKVIFSKDQGKVYSQNLGLDRPQPGHPNVNGRKGYINVRDMTLAVQACLGHQAYKAGLRSLNKLAQAGLNDRGAALVVDGLWGPKSAEAFKAWANRPEINGAYRALRLDCSARLALL